MVLYQFGLGSQEWLLILVVVVLLFGATKIPDLARAMGRAKGEYKKGIQEGKEEARLEDEDDKARDA